MNNTGELGPYDPITLHKELMAIQAAAAAKKSSSSSHSGSGNSIFFRT